MATYQELERKHFLKLCNDFIIGKKRLLIIRGGAGYGKSVTARQVASKCNIEYVVYNCTIIDKNPFALIRNILTAFTDILKDFNCELLKQSITNLTSISELFMITEDIVKPFMHDNIRHPVGIIIEDAHNLLGSKRSLQMLRLLVKIMPKSVSVIITTRYVLMDKYKVLFNSKEAVRLNQNHLEMNLFETMELYKKCYGQDLKVVEARKIYQISGYGWVAGLSLLRSHTANLDVGLCINNQSDLTDFFFKECLSRLSSKTITEMMLLAHLSVIPCKLLIDLNMKKSLEALSYLSANGLFVQETHNEDEKEFRYHNLFRSVLRSLISDNLGIPVIVDFIKNTTNWLVKQNRVEEGLLLMSSHSNWKEVSSFLSINGVKLLTNNRIPIILEALSNCPNHKLVIDAWLSTMFGHATIMENPTKGIKYLNIGALLAQQNKDSLCELLAEIGLIYYQVVINGNLRLMKTQADRAWQLYNELSNDYLPSDLEGQCCYILSIAYAYGSFEIERAKNLSVLSQRKYSEYRDSDYVPEAIVSKIYIDGVLGNIQAGLEHLQDLYIYQFSHLASPTLQFMSLLIHLNYSLMHYDFEDYYLLRSESIERYPLFIKNTNLGSFIYLYDIDILMTKGQNSELLALLDEALNHKIISNSAHLKTQCLEWQAMTFALLGEQNKAISVLFESMKSRSKIGGSYFILKNHIVAGCVYSLVNDCGRAERIFTKALNKSISVKEYYNRTIIYAYRARMRFAIGQKQKAINDVLNMISCLEHYGNFHAFFLTDELLLELLEKLSNEMTMPKFSVKILKKRFNKDVKQDGTILSRLRCNLSQGRLFYNPSSENYLDLKALREKERQLLYLLINNHRKEIPVRKAIDHLWDDLTQIKNPQNSLHQLVNQLRVKLTKMIEKNDCKEYLYFKNGYISLQHIDIDVDIFFSHGKKFIEKYNKKHLWSSDLEFKKMQIIANQFPKEFDWPMNCIETVVSAVSIWSVFFEKSRKFSKALSAVLFGLKFDPENDTLHKKKYKLYLQMDMPLKAKEAEKEYNSLLTEKYGNDLHVADVLNDFD